MTAWVVVVVVTASGLTGVFVSDRQAMAIANTISGMPISRAMVSITRLAGCAAG